jgi:transposase
MVKQDARELDHKTLEAIRIRAVRQVQAGESPEAVIRALGYSRRCIYSWLAMYRAGGWDGLKAKPIAGRPKKLRGKQIEWLYDAVTMRNPLQFKLLFALWTRGQIRTLVFRKYGTKLSLSSIGRLLAQPND